MLTVVAITAPDTHDLRRAVLRGGNPDSDVRFPQDALDDAFHLGAVRDGALVGVASFAPAPTPHRPGATAWQLRGMAVAEKHQGRGVGAALIAEAAARLQSVGATVLWCNARDTAIGFYERLGFTVVGEGFVTGATGLPHHAMVCDLS